MRVQLTLGRISRKAGLGAFAAPHLEFTIKRTHRINKEEKQDRILRAIQIANPPGNGNHGQMYQIGVERGTPNFTDNPNAEKSCHEALSRKKRQKEEPVQHDRKRMMEEIVETGIEFRTHQEKASIDCSKHKSLGKATYKFTLKDIEGPFFIESKENHAKKIFKNAYRGKNVEETILGIVTVEPKVVGKAEERGPQYSRNKECSKKNPESAIVLLEQPTAKPRRHCIANKVVSDHEGSLSFMPKSGTTDHKSEMCKKRLRHGCVILARPAAAQSPISFKAGKCV